MNITSLLLQVIKVINHVFNNEYTPEFHLNFILELTLSFFNLHR